MKRLFLLATVIIFFVSFAFISKPPGNRFYKLKKFYKDTVFVGIYSTINDRKGKQLDRATLNLFNKRSLYSENNLVDTCYQGLYSFRISKQFYGFTTKVPGDYGTPTKQELWIFDLDKDSIIREVELVNAIGDAGYSYVKNSYIFPEKNNTINLLTFQKIDFSEPGLSDEESQGNNSSTNRIYNLLQINLSPVDTISKDSLFLNKKFEKQFEKLQIE